MELIKNYKVVIALVLIVLVLVLIRSLNGSHFRNDTKKWAQPSVMRTNIISRDKINLLPGDILLICLDGRQDSSSNIHEKSVNIPADSILNKRNLNLIRKHTGSVLFSSSEQGSAARIWMILSQMGLTNIYILGTDNDNEVFKNKFRPDSISRPEL